MEKLPLAIGAWQAWVIVMDGSFIFIFSESSNLDLLVASRGRILMGWTHSDRGIQRVVGSWLCSDPYGHDVVRRFF